MRRARKTWMGVLRRFHPEVMVRVGKRRMRIDLRDRIIAKRLYFGVPWEPELLSLLRAMDLCGSVCLDVGANIGVHTLLMSELVGLAGHVYAFEPEPWNFSLLDQNLRINGAVNVTALRTALGDVSGTCRLIANPINYGDHRVSAGMAESVLGQVPISSGDEVLATLPAGAVSFVKLDVQGYEHRVLRGMRATLTRNPNAILAIEVFPEALRAAGTSPRALIEHLSDLGMVGWEVAPRLLPLQEPWLYEVIPDGQQVDVIASRNADLLRTLLQ